MASLSTRPTAFKNDFSVIAASFLQDAGLPFAVKVPGCRTESITIITTLTDPQAYSREDLAALYGFRWNVELDIRQIKQTLHLDHVRCKTPEMVRRELWVTLLAYNLIRKVIATAAAVHKKQPRHLGFTLACQSILDGPRDGVVS